MTDAEEWRYERRHDDHACLRLPETGIVCCLTFYDADDDEEWPIDKLLPYLVDALNEKGARDRLTHETASP